MSIREENLSMYGTDPSADFVPFRFRRLSAGAEQCADLVDELYFPERLMQKHLRLPIQEAARNREDLSDPVRKKHSELRMIHQHQARRRSIRRIWTLFDSVHRMTDIFREFLPVGSLLQYLFPAKRLISISIKYFPLNVTVSGMRCPEKSTLTKVSCSVSGFDGISLQRYN